MSYYFCVLSCYFFFFNDTATTEIYTLSLHDALPIEAFELSKQLPAGLCFPLDFGFRSEEHTSELQSQSNIVCRLLLEKKKQKLNPTIQPAHTAGLHIKTPKPTPT